MHCRPWLVCAVAVIGVLQIDVPVGRPDSRTVHAAASGGVSRANGSKPAYVEVKSDEQVWHGLQVARVANTQLLLTRDGMLKRIDLNKKSQVNVLGRPFDPAGHLELERGLRKEFGPKFKTQRTPHYVICHNTNDAFAQETAELVEQLYRSFTNYFGARGMGLERPQFPMVVLIFHSEAEFRQYLADTSSASNSLSQVAGIYSLETNRVAMFNAAGAAAKKYGDTRWHNLSTVIHEATHQIAFNSGCHRRLADTPVWLVEGLAMYFEAPEMQGQRIAWTSVGKLNVPRLDRFTAYRKNGRGADSLKSLVSDDERFRSDSAASDAYAESWALSYFLINQRLPQFLRYVKAMSAKPALQLDTPQERLADFQDAFGRDLRMLDVSLLRYVDDLAGKK